MITRRKFLSLGGLALPAMVGADAKFVESTSLRVTNLKLGSDPKCRFVHFTDFHHNGDMAYASEVVCAINELKPDFVCFTGDIVEDSRLLPEALDFIRQIDAPLYGNPGNHDYTSGASFREIEDAFRATGGAWLTNSAVILPQFDIELIAMDITGMPAKQSEAVSRHLLMIHYPVMADRLGNRRFDLILAGHSHGGQVRIPFFGPLVVPSGVGAYDYGRYETIAGPLHVSAGIGTLSSFPVRWNCPPEITVVSI